MFYRLLLLLFFRCKEVISYLIYLFGFSRFIHTHTHTHMTVPWRYRINRNVDAFIHIVKTTFGGGFLAMPEAFRHVGIVIGCFGTLIIGSAVLNMMSYLVSSITLTSLHYTYRAYREDIPIVTSSAIDIWKIVFFFFYFSRRNNEDELSIFWWIYFH